MGDRSTSDLRFEESQPATPLEQILRTEIENQDGTEEWRAWVERAARRHNVV